MKYHDFVYFNRINNGNSIDSPRKALSSKNRCWSISLIILLMNFDKLIAFTPNSLQRSERIHVAPSHQPLHSFQLNFKKNRSSSVVGYDSKEICDYYDRRPLVVGWRLNRLGLPLLGWYFSLLTDQYFGRDTEKIQRLRGKQLRQILVTSGSVALIKSGQALSLRPDLLKNQIWAEELSKLVDAVGSFDSIDAMNIIKSQLGDLPTIRPSKRFDNAKQKSKLERMSEKDPILSLFEFSNSNLPIASASIGQVYKAKIKRGPALVAAIGQEEADKWAGRTVAIKVQRPDAAAAASLDMYLLRRTALWFQKFRGGDLTGIADAFGQQLFGELDYIREADNCEHFRALYGGWDRIKVPEACIPLTRKKVLVQEWIEGEKGPWLEESGIDMVSLGLKCSVDQLLNTGFFHSDPHRGNLLRTPNGHLAFLDFGMMASVKEEERYGLIGLAIGLQTKDLPLITEKLLELGFLDDTTSLDLLVPRLRQAFINATGGTGKGSDVNFSKLQAELDAISSDNIFNFKTPPFFIVIIRSLTILEGFALSVDPNFRLVRGSYPYVLAQLLSPESNEKPPEALQKLLVRLLTVDGKEEEIEWERLRNLLRLAKKAQKNYRPSDDDSVDDNTQEVSRQTFELFFRFLTSKSGLFLKKPLVKELADIIDGMASISEANLLRISRGFIRPLPGGAGPINAKRMEEVSKFTEALQTALQGNDSTSGQARTESIMQLLKKATELLSDEQRLENARPLLEEVTSVIRLVAVEVLEMRGSRAMRRMLNLNPAPSSSNT